MPGEAVLELGFGTGNEVGDLAGLVGPTGRVAGIDISPGMLAVANRKLAEAMPKTPVDLRVGDARSLPFGDGEFDAVYTSFTLELFPADDIPVVLAEARRVLKPGGRIGVVSMATVRPGHHNERAGADLRLDAPALPTSGGLPPNRHRVGHFG